MTQLQASTGANGESAVAAPGSRDGSERSRCRVIGGAVVEAVSAVVVNFNGGALLGRSVESLLACGQVAELYVVDNGSGDASLDAVYRMAEHDRRVRVLENKANLGFAAAANRALQKQRGEYVLLVNPDCIVGPASIGRVLEVMRADATIGMAGCLVRNPDGSEQRAARRRMPTPARALVDLLRLDALFAGRAQRAGIDLRHEALGNEPVEAEALSGAFLAVRRAAIEEVGLLDEGYFLHCEDLDWCMRFRQKGWKIMFVPDVSVVHAQGTCSRARPVRVEWHKHRGMMRFYRKFFRDRYPLPLMALVAVGVWMHFALLAAVYSIRHVGRFAGITRG